MKSDFHDACLRHFEDAERLYNAERWANADHLFGISAECGLKRLMVAFGMETKSSGDPKEEKYKVHADKIWDRYETFRSGRPQASGYGLDGENSFGNWHATQRYALQSEFDRGRVSPHRDAAGRVRSLLGRAERDGLLS